MNNPANDPYRIFDDCDEDKSGDIDQTELNKFLYASEVNEFKDIDIRRFLIAEVFQNQEKISKDSFFKLFKVKKDHLNRYQKEIKSQPQTIEYSAVRQVKIPKKIIVNPEEEPERKETKPKFNIRTVET